MNERERMIEYCRDAASWFHNHPTQYNFEYCAAIQNLIDLAEGIPSGREQQMISVLRRVVAAIDRLEGTPIEFSVACELAAIRASAVDALLMKREESEHGIAQESDGFPYGPVKALDRPI